MKKPIPKGKKGKGIRKLKKVAPQVAKRMGYKKGKRVCQMLRSFKKLIEEAGSEKERDKLFNKYELATKMAERKETSVEQELINLGIQERFDKDSISSKTDIIGDDNLSNREGSFRKGGLVKKGKPKLARKGWR